MLVCAVVVHHEVQGGLAGKLVVEPSQKLQELLVPVPFVTLTHDLALEDFQCGKKRGRAVAFIVVLEDQAEPVRAKVGELFSQYRPALEQGNAERERAAAISESVREKFAAYQRQGVTIDAFGKPWIVFD